MLKRREFRVYRFKTMNKTIIYVGYTGKEIIDRFSEHSKDKYWINDVAEVEECIIENEGQARIVEIQYINMLKPLFNKKDKFPGAVLSKLRPRDKKFNHSFFVFNGTATKCVPKTNDDHTVVGLLTVAGDHIGQYYDGYLNLYYSANDICTILDINKKDLVKLAKDNKNFTKTSYDICMTGKDKTQDLYLCNHNGVKEILSISKSSNTLACKNLIEVSAFNNDINYLYPDNRTKKELFVFLKDGLSNIEGVKANDKDIRRRLIFKSISCNKDIKDVVEDYNKEMSIYNSQAHIEPFASDIFAMIEDLLNEYGSSYKDFLYSFSEYLKENHDTNFWSINASTKKKHDNPNLKAHYVIALNEETLYEPFFLYYEECLERTS